RMLAGLEAVTSGDLLLDGERVNDVPAQARDMAMVFENYALYPHLRVFDNIAMPLVARRRPRAEIRERVRQVAETLRITEHLGKRPHTLSGGQRQRVALGRAIVRTPRMADSLGQEYGHDLSFGIRPQDVTLAHLAGDGTLPGQVTLLEPQGSRTVVIADTPAGRMSAVAASHAVPPAGAAAHFRFDM